MASAIAAQLYTVRDFTQTPDGVVETLKKVAAAGYEAVQLSALAPMDPRELRNICDGEGLAICSTHIDYGQMRDEPEKVIEEHHILGCKYPAIGGMPSEYRNAQDFVGFAKDASEVVARLAEAGLIFGYHNHNWELEKFGGRTVLQIFFEESDPRYFTFELDTYWVQAGGGSPVDWINKLKGRMPLLHLKDMTMRGGQQIMAEIGEGNLDWPGILAAAKDAGVVWYIVEQDTCERDPFESLKISLENLKAMGLQ